MEWKQRQRHLALRFPVALETFLSGMETGRPAPGGGDRHPLETFLSGMETGSSQGKVAEV